MELSARWLEQALTNNVIHKTRLPRGGTLDIVAVLDPSGKAPGTPPHPRGLLSATTVSISVTPPMKPTSLWVNGVASAGASTELSLAEPDESNELRWRFELPWDRSAIHRDYTFTVSADLPPQSGRVVRSITLEQGLACYDTTLSARLKKLAASRFVSMTTLGKTPLGRDLLLLRVTDPSVPDAGKKPFFILGPWHGNESSGRESIPDFLGQLAFDPQFAHYLRKAVVFAVPDANPDGRELGQRTPVGGVDLNQAFADGVVQQEATVIVEAMTRIRAQLEGGIVLCDHQWMNPWLMISHDYVTPHDDSDRLVRNVAIALSNHTGEFFNLCGGPDPTKPVSNLREYINHELRLPVCVIETPAGNHWNLADLGLAIERELRVYRTFLDFLTGAPDAVPMPHPALHVRFPEARTLRTYKVDKAPSIDGQLNDEVWKTAASISDMRTIGTEHAPVGSTTFYACYDDRCLYVAMRTTDLQPSGITGHDPPEPGIWTGDGCEVFLDVHLNQWSYFHFQANAQGAFADNFYVAPRIADNGTYNPAGCEVAACLEAGIVEIAIPFTSFNTPESADPMIEIPPKPGTVWGVNFIRNAHGGLQGAAIPVASWSVLDGTAHSPSSFNGLRFMGSP